MRLQAFCQFLIFLTYFLSASSLDHEKSFLYQDGASSVLSLGIYRDSLLLTASNDIVQKDIQTGAIQRTFRAHQSLVYSFAVTNDSRMISSGYDDMIIVWDLETGSILKRIWLKGLDARINSLAVQNNFVIAGGLDSKVRQIDLVSGRVVRTIALNGFVFSVVFSGEYFYIGKQNPPNLIRYSTQTGVANLKYDRHISSVFSVFLSNDILVSGSADTTVICWNASTARVIHVLRGHTNFVQAVGIFDGYLYSSGDDTNVIKWSIENGQIVQKFPPLHFNGVASFAYKQSELFTGSFDTSVKRWDAASADFLFSYEGKNMKLTVVAAWKNFAITSGENVEVEFWDTTIESIKPFNVLVDQAITINCLYVYESSLFSGGSDRKVKQWDLTKFTLKKTFEGSANLIVSVTAFQDFVYSSGYGVDIFQWNISSGVLTGRFVRHTGFVESVINDGGSLYSGSRDRTIRMWNVISQQTTRVFFAVDSLSALLRVEDSIIACSYTSLESFSITSGETLGFTNEPDGCYSIASSRDRTYTGHPDGVIRVRDLYTLNVIEVLRGHSNFVTSLCFDESYNLYSAGFDGTIKKWNLITRKVAYSFESRLGSVTSLVAVGDHLYVGTQGGNVFSYNIDNAKASATLRYFNQSVTSLLAINGAVYASSLDGLLVKFSASTPNDVLTIYNSNTDSLRSLTINKEYLLSLLGETNIAFFYNETVVKTWDLPRAIICIAATNQFVLGGSRSGVIYSWNLETFELAYELKGHVGQVNYLLAVGQNLFSASDDKSIIEWSMKDAISTNTYKRLSASSLGHLGPFNSLSFCFGALFSAGSDLSVRRWNPMKASHDDVYFGFSDAVTTLLCYNGSVFAGGRDSAVLLFKPFLDDLYNITTSSVTMISTNRKMITRVFAKSRLLQSSATTALSLVLAVSGVAALFVGLSGAYVCVKFYRRPTAEKTPTKTQNDLTLTMTDLNTIVNSIVGISKHAEFLIPSSIIARSKKLASGGGGELFIAKVMDPSLQRKVGDTVIQKVVFTTTKSIDESFYQEVGIMIMLSTFPHFCKIIGYTENPLSMILKFYPEGSLHEWLRKNQTFSRFAVKLLKELSEALYTMHSHYLAHCDIKPQNILMEVENGVPSCFLTDFGITQILSEEILASRMFRITNLRGLSVHYASPEAFTNFRSKRYVRVDFKKYDVYSYGCVVYDFVTKRSPWD